MDGRDIHFNFVNDEAGRPQLHLPEVIYEESYEESYLSIGMYNS